MSSHIGTTIGDFEVLELIGQGGMSFVYLALDRELERHVALKIPRGRFLDDPSFVDRFKREARAMARLRHPGIVQIYTVGSHDDTPYFAMEYVRSESLEKVVKEKGPLGIAVSLKYITQIARSLGYAHKKGVVHRDIKPANILVDSSGRLLLTDFGVSKLLSEESVNETMGFLGTPQYMSPEQCGQGTLDHRTDIYSMGAVLFEMLTGQPAFSSSSPAEVIKKQLFDMPEFPAEFKDKIPENLQALIAKMLAKDPDERYPNIPMLLRDIEKLGSIDADAQGSALSSSAETITIENPQASLMKGAAKRAMRPKKKRRRARVVLAAACLFFVLAMISLAATINMRTHRTDVDLPLSERVEQFGREALAFLSPASSAALKDEQPVENSLSNEAAASPSGHSEAVAALMPEPAAHAEVEVQAAPEPQPAEPQPIQFATMVITSNPSGAAVALDSKHRGTTPLTLSDVTPASHVLVARLDGYPTHVLETPVGENASVEIFHDFVAAREALIPKGSLTIDSDPPGAVVYVNGKKRGTTRLELPDLRSADYTVSLQLEGYEPVKKQITLLPDENLRIGLSLVEKIKFGSLSISSRPGGAEVFLDGKSRGITPLALGKVPVGQYDVVLKKKGYKPYGARFTCRKDSRGAIEAELEMTPKFAARESMIEGDRHAKMGELEQAAEKYERAISLDPENPMHSSRLKLVRRSLIKKEVRDLLSSYKVAYDSENAELLASLLDEGDSDFLANQVADARGLFREFDNIELALSRPKLSLAASGTVSVSLHFNMSADFRETGSSAELLNTDRKLTLRREPGAGWKICAIE